MSDYYYLHEPATIAYTLAISTGPPADQAYVNVHQGGQDGPIKETQQLDPMGTGTLNLDLTNYTVDDSPLFLEFIAVKEGQQTQAWQAASLAEGTPATITVPATANAGDQAPLQVATWAANYYDNPGGQPSGNAAEIDITRIPDADKQMVTWRVNGTDLATKGDSATYPVDPSQVGQALSVEAYIGTPSGVAVGTIQVAAAATSEFVLMLAMSPKLAALLNDQFILSSADGSFKQTKTVSADNADQDASDGTIELHFTGLDPNGTYTLQAADSGDDPYYLFQGLPYSGLATWSPPADDSDPGSTDPGSTDPGSSASPGGDPAPS